MTHLGFVRTPPPSSCTSTDSSPLQFQPPSSVFPSSVSTRSPSSLLYRLRIALPLTSTSSLPGDLTPSAFPERVPPDDKAVFRLEEKWKAPFPSPSCCAGSADCGEYCTALWYRCVRSRQGSRREIARQRPLLPSALSSRSTLPVISLSAQLVRSRSSSRPLCRPLSTLQDLSTPLGEPPVPSFVLLPCYEHAQTPAPSFQVLIRKIDSHDRQQHALPPYLHPPTRRDVDRFRQRRRGEDDFAARWCFEESLVEQQWRHGDDRE